ncbi:patatin-like phospholipase family protein [Mangrovibrevibacter kandeliae]|uniref:patatin-like phospholipase family protein n=1 Tax=Mangrovibrevibacter kandeliae TaxID=2968473 RepID=UPI002118E80C|nr:patatin-like phospholipase family protein [Aurantimonas sp. CSK15Z-1]MCQ8782049.1 patatin-like phospholipase family protein [Aurantimonas sp. CSK15Z-1]
MAGPSIALALGGGGARGLAHIHVLEAFDELGLKPACIAGSSIGAIIGAGYAAGLTGHEIREHILSVFAHHGVVLARLWRTLPPSFSAFRQEGGLRLGQLNAERVLEVFMPERLPATFEELAVPLTVMATDFYAGESMAIDSGALMSAVAASAALPALFRPVRRDGKILIDGGIYSPLPFEVLRGCAERVVAVDVTGSPVGDGRRVPPPMEVTSGASQLIMRAITEAKLKLHAPDLLVRPPVSRYGVFDFMQARVILADTAALKDEVKRALDHLLSREADDRGLPLILDEASLDAAAAMMG